MIASLIANGIDPYGMPWDTAEDVLGILVQTGRAIPASKWVDAIIIQADNERGRAQHAALRAMAGY